MAPNGVNLRDVALHVEAKEPKPLASVHRTRQELRKQNILKWQGFNFHRQIAQSKQSDFLAVAANRHSNVTHCHDTRALLVLSVSPHPRRGGWLTEGWCTPGAFAVQGVQASLLPATFQTRKVEGGKRSVDTLDNSPPTPAT